MDSLDGAAQGIEMGWWGHLEGEHGSNLQLHPRPAPPPSSLSACCQPLGEAKEGGGEGVMGL